MFGFSFPDSLADETPVHPPPPTSEVLHAEGRVRTKEVFRLPNSDLVPGVYWSGCSTTNFQVWEASLDRVKALLLDIQNGNMSLTAKRVLEVGFKFSALMWSWSSRDLCMLVVLFFAGEWSRIHQLLPCVNYNENDLNFHSGASRTSGYDIILMAETIYSVSADKSLYGLIKKCISRPHRVLYLAAKKHYFGVGGGTRLFPSVMENDGEILRLICNFQFSDVSLRIDGVFFRRLG